MRKMQCLKMMITKLLMRLLLDFCVYLLSFFDLLCHILLIIAVWMLGFIISCIVNLRLSFPSFKRFLVQNPDLDFSGSYSTLPFNISVALLLFQRNETKSNYTDVFSSSV
jgi:hypothetical protein